VKQGRELFAKVVSAEAGLVKAISAMKGRELDALITYAEGLPDDDGRNEVIGMAVIEAARRYLAKARKKAEKRMRRVRKVL
jgi:hypothetical protein